MKPKRKRVKKPPDKKHLKIGDSVAWTTRKKILFGFVVNLAKDCVTVRFPGFYDQVDFRINEIVHHSEFTARHHKLLLGVTP